MFKKYTRIFLLLSLPLQFFLYQWLASDPVLIEKIYTNGFYKGLSWGLRVVFGIVPVPVGQLIFYSLVAFLLGQLLLPAWLLWRKQINLRTFFLKFGFGSLLFLSVFYFLFMVMWGLNYHRLPIQVLANLNDQPFTKAELINMCRRLIWLTNTSREAITTHQNRPLAVQLTDEQILNRAPLGFAVAAKIYPNLSYSQPAVKQVYIPELMSFFGIAGIYFPFTGEANVNMDPPQFLLPSTVCHEMAHQIGFASEDEANLVSFLACRHHPEPAFRYSGNFMAMRYAMGRLRQIDSVAFNNLKQTWSPGVQQDLEAGKKYWESFQGPLELISEKLNDIFLKANSQEEGVQSYSRVVELLMGEYRKNGLKPVSVN